MATKTPKTPKAPKAPKAPKKEKAAPAPEPEVVEAETMEPEAVKTPEPETPEPEPEPEPEKASEPEPEEAEEPEEAKAEAPVDLSVADMPMGDGIHHLKETLYDIRPGAIAVAKRPDDVASLKKYTWFNPRFLTATGDGKGEDMGYGFDRERMSRLREDIINHGLHNPLICRWVIEDGVLEAQLVDGHRRLMVVEFLVRKNEKVYDQHQRKFVSAKEKFSSVVCHVYHAQSDEECLALAYQESKSRVDFGPEADLKIVRMLRNHGKSDDEILDITGQKPDWLKKMDKVIAADDEDVAGAFCEGFIDLDAAEFLVGIEEKDKRGEALTRVVEFAAGEAQKNLQRLERSIQKTRESIEVAKADKAEAEFKEDEEAAEKAKERQESLEHQVEEKQREKEEIRPKAGKRVAKEAAEAVGASTNGTSSTVSSGSGNGSSGTGSRGTGRPSGTSERPPTLGYKLIKSRYLDTLSALIANDGVDSEGQFVGPIDYLKSLHAVVKGIYDGESEPMKIFRKWGKKFEPVEEETDSAK